LAFKELVLQGKKNLKIDLNNFSFDVILKNIKSINIRISAPLAQVKISAPRRVSLRKIKTFIAAKLDWIEASRQKILSQKYDPPKRYKDGESHDFFGKKYSLRIIEKNQKPNVEIQGDHLILQIRPSFKKLQKEKLLQNWYRAELKQAMPVMIEKWEREMKVKVLEFNVKKMTTRWGTCNPSAKRIWVSLELAKRPIECLEYIVVHEMVHLLERKHNARFHAFMDRFLPEWKRANKMLKS
jgi:predicted metal-dependent hydrolase